MLNKKLKNNFNVNNMKQALIIVLVFIGVQLKGQSISGCENVSLKSNIEIKEAEPCVKKLSEFALMQPMIGCSEEGHYARKVVYAWVESTQDYTFSLNNSVMKIFNDKNLLLFTTYVACLANAALTKGASYEKYGLELFVNYIRNPDNKVDQSKLVVRLVSDWDNNKIDKYLK